MSNEQRSPVDVLGEMLNDGPGPRTVPSQETLRMCWLYMKLCEIKLGNSILPEFWESYEQDRRERREALEQGRVDGVMDRIRRGGRLG